MSTESQAWDYLREIKELERKLTAAEAVIDDVRETVNSTWTKHRIVDFIVARIKAFDEDDKLQGGDGE